MARQKLTVKKIEIPFIRQDDVSWDELKDFRINTLKAADGRDVSKLKAAIIDKGFTFPFFVWAEQSYILDGAGRIKALQELEAEGVDIPALPVIFISANDEDKARELVLMVSSQHGTITQDSFLSFSEGLDLEDIFQYVSLPGIDFTLEDPEEEPEAEGDPDDAPAAPKEPVTKLGDVWEIGPHRLVCGDCTDVYVLDTLTGGIVPDLVFTDPPYGVDIVRGDNTVGGPSAPKFGSIGGKNKAKSNKYLPIAGDNSTEAAQQFHASCVALGVKNFIIWGGNYFTDFLTPSMCWLVWDKENSGNYADVELAWTSYDKAAKLYKWMWNGMARKGDRATEGVRRVHPTQKPVGLFNEIFKDFEFSTVLDGFGGSGSTMVAAHQSGKTAYLMELEPSYCDVIISRMVSLWPDLEIKLNGASYTWEAERSGPQP